MYKVVKTPKQTRYYYLPELTGDSTQYGNASMTNLWSGFSAYQFTRFDSYIMANDNTTPVFTFNFSVDYYIPQGKILKLTYVPSNSKDVNECYYAATGFRLDATYTDNTTETLYDNASLFYPDFSGNDTTFNVDSSITNGIIKSINVTNYYNGPASPIGINRIISYGFTVSTLEDYSGDGYLYKVSLANDKYYATRSY